MKCREVRNTLGAYLDGEVTPSERTVVDGHLAGCEGCRREWTALSSRRAELTGSLKTIGAQASPSPQAWIHLQEALAREPLPADTKQLLSRKGERHMRLRWRIALGVAGAAVLAVAVIAAVPASRAAAGDMFAQVFHMREFKMMQLTYVPAGFDQGLQGGTMTVGNTSDQNGQDVESETGLYRDGDQFIYVKIVTDTGDKLPAGQTASVKGKKAVLVTGLSGTVDELWMQPEPPGMTATTASAEAPAAGGQPVDIKGAGIATVISGSTVVTGGGSAAPGEAGVSSSSGDAGGPSPQTEGTAPASEPLTYANATSLTWKAGGMRLEIVSNLSAAEIIKVAEGLVPGGSTEVQQ